MRAAGVLTRLSLAWSRDDKEKFYVQDHMRQVGGDVWQWLSDGAHFYVCGAVRMGQDVERAMVDIVAERPESVGTTSAARCSSRAAAQAL